MDRRFAVQRSRLLKSYERGGKTPGWTYGRSHDLATQHTFVFLGPSRHVPAKLGVWVSTDFRSRIPADCSRSRRIASSFSRAPPERSSAAVFDGDVLSSGLRHMRLLGVQLNRKKARGDTYPLRAVAATEDFCVDSSRLSHNKSPAGNVNGPRSGDRMLGVSQVATMLGMSERTLRYLASLGELPAMKVGRAWRFWLSEILEYLEKHRGENLLAVAPDSSRPSDP